MGAGAAIGAIIGAVGTAAEWWAAGVTLFSAVMTGMSIGSLFDKPKKQSPTYDFGVMQNTRDADLPVPVVYGRHRVAGNYIFEGEPGPVEYSEKIYTKDNATRNIYVLSRHPIEKSPKPEAVVYERYTTGKTPRTAYRRLYPQPSYTVDYTGGRIIFDSLPDGNDAYYCIIKYYAIPTEVSDISFGIAISEGPVNSITEIEADKIPIGSVSESSYAIYLGTADQTPDPRNPKGEYLRNTAYMAFSFKANKQVSGGNPNITSVVEGRIVKVYDSVTQTWKEEWTQNPAFCVLDFMTNTRYGCGIPENEINLDSIVETAEYCDEPVDDGNGEQETRFQLDIVLDTRNPAPDNLEIILKTFGGFLVWSDGQYHLKCEKGEMPSGEFTDKGEFPNIVEEQTGDGGFKTTLQISESSSDEVPNRLIVEFMDPENPNGGWQMSPIVINDDVDQYVRGEIVEKTIQLIGVTRASQAGRMAKFYYDKLRRCSKNVSFRAPIWAMDVEAGDVRYITHTVPGWNKKMIRVTAVAERDDDEVEIIGQLHDPNIYHDLIVPYVPQQSVNRANPLVVPNPENLELSDQSFILASGELVTQLDVKFNIPAYAHFGYCLVEISEDGTSWKEVARTAIGAYSIYGVKIGKHYVIRVTTVSTLGAKSTGITGEITTIGKDYAPSDVSGLTAVQNEYNRAEILLSWPAVDAMLNPDLKGYEVRVGESWETGNKVGGLVYGLKSSYTVAAGGHYIFWVKAQDNSGGYSVNAAKVEIDVTVKPNASASGTAIQDVNDKVNLILSWDAVSDKDFAKFEVRLGNDWDAGAVIATTKETSVQYRVNASGAYNFMVRAVNLAGFMSAILNIQANIDVHPSNVTNLTALQSDTDRRIVKFAWNGIADKDFAYYEIRKGTAWGNATVVASKIGNPYYDFVATTSETVTFWVAAYNKAGFSSNDPISKTISISLVPSKPGTGSVVSDPSNRFKLNISWDKVADLDIDFYEVKYGSTVIAKTGETAISYIVSVGGNHAFSVRAKNKADVYSSPLNLTATVQAEPTNVSSFTVQQSPLDRRVLQFAWSAVTDADLSHYEIRKGSNWDTAEVLATGIKATVLEKMTGVEETATFLIKAITTGGSGSAVVASKTIDVILKPSKPAAGNVSYSPSNKANLVITWTGITDTDLVNYEVRKGTNWATAAVLGTTRETAFTYMADASGNYDFLVCAKNVGGYYSSPLNLAFTATIEPLDVTGFTGVQMVNDHSKVRLSWNAVTEKDFDYYEIREGVNWDSGTIIATRLTGVFYDATISEERVYTYWIRAFNKAGKSSLNPAKVEGSFNMNPTAPASLTVQVDPLDKSNLLINWGEVLDQDLQDYTLKVGSTWETGAEIARTKELKTTWKPGVSGNYKFLLRSRNLSGFESDEVIATVDAYIEPADVTGFVAAQNGETVSMSWNRVAESDVVGYEIREGGSFENGSLVVTGLSETKYAVNVDTETTKRYHVKAINRAGRYSQNAASASVTITGLPPKNVIFSYDEIALQNGIHENTEFGESLINFSNLDGRFSDYPNTKFDEIGGQTVLKLKGTSGVYPGSGTYTCTRKDMGSIITANISSQFVSTVLLRSGVSANLQYRISRDGTNWTEWQNFAPVQATFRYVDFRVLLNTSDPSKTPEVNTLQEVIDVPDVDKYGTATIAVGGSDVVYGHTYWQTPVVSPTAIGQGLRAELVSVAKDKFRVRVLNLSGTDVGGQINWISRGF